MTEEQKEDIKLLKELIADTSIPNDDREIYQEALNQILAQTKSDMPKEAKEKMPKKEKATPKAKASKKPKAEKPTALPSDVDAMKKAIKERTGKTEAECEDIIAQYRKLRAKAKVNNAKRTEKLKSNDDLITGTNVITPVAQIEKDAEIVKAKIEKQVEQIENKAEREVVKKDKTKDEVKVEVEQKVVKQLAKLSDEMVSSATTFVKNIQTELKKVDKTEAKNFLLGLRNEIDALLSKFGDGGTTEIYNIAEMNSSSSSVNPSKFAKGGGVDDYIDEQVNEFRTEKNAMRQQYRGYVRDIEYQGFLAIDENDNWLSDYEFEGEEFDRDNLLEVAKKYPQAEYITFHARLMGDSDFGIEDELSPIDDLAMSFDMDKLNQFKRGGGVRIGSDGREYPFGSAWALEHNKNNKSEKYEIPTSSRKS